MNLPEDLKYAKSHEWVRLEGDIVTVGISDHAQSQLGDIVSLELPDVGSNLAKGDGLALVDSMKATSDIYAPVSGEVIEVNEALEDAPELVNESPYEDGWIAKLKISDPSELDTLMDHNAYRQMVEQE